MNIYTGLSTAIVAAVARYLDNVFPTTAPEGYGTPYATYRQIFSNHLKVLDGYEGEKSVDYQFDFCEDTYTGAKTAQELFIEYIKNFKGVLGTSTVQDVEILYESDANELVGSKVRYIATTDVRFTCV